MPGRRITRRVGCSFNHLEPDRLVELYDVDLGVRVNSVRSARDDVADPHLVLRLGGWSDRDGELPLVTPDAALDDHDVPEIAVPPLIK